jgi:rRNA maturation endonuclease Nob1
MLAAGAKPLTKFKSSKVPWRSECLTCGKKISPRLGAIIAGQNACAFCAGNKTDPDEAVKLMRESNLEPLEPYSNARVEWKCRCLGCGEIVFPLYNSIQQGQGGCKDCGYKKTAESLRISQEDAVQFARAAGFEPAEPYVSSEDKWKMKCLKCLKFFYPTLHNVRQGSGCPSCAKSGFDPNEKGYFYFLEHLRWEMFQIGITNFPDKRLKQHKRIGWEVLELRGPMDGHLTQNWETAILRMLKAKGADLSNSEIAGKYDGYSEAWSKSTFEAKSIKDLMRLTEEFEG